MSRPYFFSWVEEPLLAACAWPNGPEELGWVRSQGIQIVISLTEDSLPRDWVDGAGLMSVHIPVPDMDSPTEEQIEKGVSVIEKGIASKMGVLVHCMAGRGRTGTLLASYLVKKGMSAREAIRHIRQLRPGSVEVADQEGAVYDYEEYLKNNRE